MWDYGSLFAGVFLLPGWLARKQTAMLGNPTDKELQADSTESQRQAPSRVVSKGLRADSESQRQAPSDGQQGTEAPRPPVVRN